jgi:ubiquinone/menaquinone biosynthesis C-methylase UbiE
MRSGFVEELFRSHLSHTEVEPVTNSPIATEDRYWQNWDKGDAAKKMDEYWQADEGWWREALGADLLQEFGRNTTILEVGSGSGMIYDTLRQRGIVNSTTYTGGDLSDNMLTIARTRFPGVNFLKLDAFRLDLADRSHPNVISIHVLQHLPNYEQALRELIRVSSKRLYVASWFDQTVEDQLELSAPSERWDGQRFQNNYYSLPRFLSFLVANSDRRIAYLRVYHIDGPNYTVSVIFEGGPSEKRRSTLVRRALGRLRRLFSG